MPSSFPGAIDNFTDPLAGSPLNSPSHSGQHSDLNDAVEKIETYMGLVKVIPTGATNGTVGATGTVTIGNAVSSVTVSGVFSSLYTDYLIRYSVSAQSANATVRYSHNVSSGSNYFSLGQQMAWGSTTITGIGAGGATTCEVGRYESGLGRVTGQIMINLPNSATRKMGQCWCASPGYGYHGQIQIATASVDTGFILAPSTGNWTGGTITVYGYRD